jgi:hypothetical protein
MLRAVADESLSLHKATHRRDAYHPSLKEVTNLLLVCDNNCDRIDYP